MSNGQSKGNGTSWWIAVKYALQAVGIAVTVLVAVIPWMMRIETSLAVVQQQMTDVAKQLANHRAERDLLRLKLDSLEERTRQCELAIAARREDGS